MNQPTPSAPHYAPMLAATTWAQVQSFVADIIANRCAHMTRFQTDEHQRTLAYFCDWVVQTGMADVHEALADDVIDVYTEDRAREVAPVMAERERKMLRALAGITPAVERRRVSTASQPERPYTPAEVARFHTWATHQRTEHQRLGCLAVFTLALGCGLTGGEIMAARGDDLINVEGTPAVHVARDGRIVPVVDRWRHCYEQLVEMAAPGLLVAPKAGERKAAMATILRYSSGEAKPTAARLRMTWLVAHLEAGTPLAALLPASGMTSTDSLRRAMSFVQPLAPATSIAALRMTEQVR